MPGFWALVLRWFGTRASVMSWQELERLVVDAETRPHLRHLLRRCRDDNGLLLQARLLGYRITRVDLQQAWLQHRQDEELKSLQG
jgi:hypothetical protein